MTLFNSTTLSITSTGYNGISATRGNIAASGGGTGYLQTMTRSGHFMRSSVSKVKLLLGNFYVAGGSNWQESSVGGAITATASIEYPAGTFTQIKLSGSSTFTIPDLSTVVTDYANVSIPAGALFWVRQFWQLTAGGLPYYFGKLNSNMGDAMSVSTSAGVLTDQTMGGTVANTGNSGSGINFPLAVISPITIPSVWYCGDSIDDGQGDNIDAGGDVGITGRSIGPSFGYSSNCTSGDMAHFFKTSNSLRKAALAFCTSAIFGFGRNDFEQNLSNLATFQSDLTTCYLGIPGNVKKSFQRTVLPSSSSTDGYTTVGNQTRSAHATDINNFNDSIRNGSFGPGNFLDWETALESSLNSGKWIATPSPPYCDNQGIHPLPAGIALAVAGNVIPTSVIQ